MTRRSLPARMGLIALLAGVLVGCGLTPVGGAVVPPGRSCQGLAPDLCQRELRNIEASRPGQQVVGFHMRCIAAVCDASQGEAEILVAWADGSTETLGTAWAGAAPPVPEHPVSEPAPPESALPVVPGCHDLPQSRCLEIAEAALEGIDHDTVAAIAVRCMQPPGCDEALGKGESVVTLMDGTESRSDWAYDD